MPGKRETMSEAKPKEAIHDMLIRVATEELAKLEHEQWGHWMEYLDKYKVGQPNHPEFNGLQWDRWMQLSKTPYKELTELDKESDRVWARKVLDILGLSNQATMRAFFASQIQSLDKPNGEKTE